MLHPKTMKENSKNRFMSLQSVDELSLILGMSLGGFTSAIENVNYKLFEIPKKTGGTRLISSPDPLTRKLQSKLYDCLKAYYQSVHPNCVHGFIPKQEAKASHHIKANAQVHLGMPYLLNIDIKDFFHSISTKRVRSLFANSPFYFDHEVSTALALLCCYDRKLPMGACTSPVISNLVCLQMDALFMKWSHAQKINYTRYADDISFSSSASFNSQQMQAIKGIIEMEGFTINEKKIRLQSKHTSQWVTGIKVNQKLNVNRTYVRNLRAILYDIKTNGWDEACSKHFRLEGNKINAEHLKSKFYLKIKGKIQHIAYVKGYNDEVYNKLNRQFLGL